MLLLAIVALLNLALLSFAFSRTWWYPPALFSAYWGCILVVCSIANIWTYQLPGAAVLAFLGGAVVFSGGGFLATLFFGAGKTDRGMDSARREGLHRWLRIGAWISIISVPGYIMSIFQVADKFDITSIPLAAHHAMSLPNRGGIPRVFFVIGAVGTALAYLAAWLFQGGWRDTVTLLLALVGPLITGVLSFSRTGVYTLVIGVVGILAARGRIRKSLLVTMTILGLCLSLVMGALLDKLPGFSWDLKGIAVVSRHLAEYFVGGPLGFGQVMDCPWAVGESGLSLRFFTQPLQSAGADLRLPNHVLGYYSSDLGNIYTMYFAYWLDAGWYGLLGISLLAGFVCTAVFHLALRGNAIAGSALGLVVSSVLNSAVGDGLFGTAIPWLVIAVVGATLWRISYSKEARGRNAHPRNGLL